jgi:D-3-phosphoglycerate dehydrogenase
MTTKPRVLISDELSPAAVQIFRTRGIEVDFQPELGKDKDRLAAIIADYDGLAIRSATKVTAGVLERAARLRVVGRAGIGVDNVDVPAATQRGIVVMNTPFGNAITTAEHAIALMFAAARQIAAADASTQAGKWEKSRFMGAELYAKTLGLIGCGNIGSIVADRALGLKMKVVAYDPFLSPDRALEIGVEKVELEQLLSRADIISLHVPLTDKTRNILSAENLARTRRGVMVVNAARGGLVDEQALRVLLDKGHVAAAAFDVFSEEPASQNPLFGAPNFTATPHLGAATSEAQENVALQVADQMADYLLTGAVTNALNMPSITADEAPRLKPFVTLAQLLGSLAGQLAEGPLTRVEVRYLGDVARLNVKPLTAAALAGVLRPMLAEVNMVSAPAMARERGIELSEAREEEARDYDSLVSIEVTAGGKVLAVLGALFAGEPRILAADGMPLEAPFAPDMLYVRNEDTPGVIGRLATTLGESGVNIATFHLGRVSAGGVAASLLGLDAPLAEAVAGRVSALPAVTLVRALTFQV